MPINITLNRIREHRPCESGWVKLLKHLGKTAPDNEPLSLLTVFESNGLDDALWCLRAVEGHEKEIRQFARDCALDVIHLWDAPSVVKEYLETGDEKLRDAARDAAWDAAWAAAMAARAAAMAARDAALAAAWDAARYAAIATKAAAIKIQEARFKKMIGGR